MNWQAHADTMREELFRRQARRADERYVVIEVWADGNPTDLQAFEDLTDALDLRDELHRERPGRRGSGPLFLVYDRDDPELGYLDHEDTDFEPGMDSAENVRQALRRLREGTA